MPLKVEWRWHQFTSVGVCPGLLMPGWSCGLLTGAVRCGTGLPRTTVVGVVEVEETGLEAGWGSRLCWMKASASGVSCLKGGRLFYRRQTSQKCAVCWDPKKSWPKLSLINENDDRIQAFLPWGKAQGKVEVKTWALCTMYWWIPQLPVCPPNAICRHKELGVKAVTIADTDDTSLG